MNDNIRYMLEKYQLSTIEDQEMALREIVQNIVLLGLSRGNFFQEAAFYRGTALRIFYGLDRFSEDLDFTALDKSFKGLDLYKKNIEAFLAAYDFEFEFSKKEKKTQSPIESAFIKGNTNVNLLKVGIKSNQNKDALIKVKLEIDTSPAIGFNTEAKLLAIPEACYVQTLNLPSLCAGKIHAILFRERKINIKGRDWYDLMWYLNKKIPYNFQYLKNKMEDTIKEFPEDRDKFKIISPELIKEIILEKINHLDIKSVRADVSRFVRMNSSLDIWSQKYFKDNVTANLFCEADKT